MDPNDTLRMIRAYVKRIQDWEAGKPGDEDIPALASALAEYAEAMDEWLSKGGFPPSAWPLVSVL